jgi:hypothetical protein
MTDSKSRWEHEVAPTATAQEENLLEQMAGEEK